MEYKIKFKKEYGYGSKLYYHRKNFVVDKSTVYEIDSYTEIDRQGSRSWYDKSTYMEVTSNILISLLEGNNIQKILALNIIQNLN